MGWRVVAVAWLMPVLVLAQEDQSEPTQDLETGIPREEIAAASQEPVSSGDGEDGAEEETPTEPLAEPDVPPSSPAAPGSTAVASEAGVDAPAEPVRPSRIAVMPLRAGTGIEKEVVEAISEAIAVEVRQVPNTEVITRSDITAMLGYERQKAILGCSDESCIAEIGGALGADLLVTGTMSLVGASWLLTIKLIDTKHTVTKAESHQRLKEKSLDDVLDNVPVMVSELFPEQWPFGFLTISTIPDGAMIRIDGEELTPSPIVGRKMEPGAHQIHASLQCFHDATQTLQVSRGQSDIARMELAPLLVPVDVSIDAPDGDVTGEVLAGNVLYGQAPGVVELPVCLSSVEVRLADGRAWSAEIQLREGVTNALRAAFEAPGPAAPAAKVDSGATSPPKASGPSPQIKRAKARRSKKARQPVLRVVTTATAVPIQHGKAHLAAVGQIPEAESFAPAVGVGLDLSVSRILSLGVDGAWLLDGALRGLIVTPRVQVELGSGGARLVLGAGWMVGRFSIPVPSDASSPVDASSYAHAVQATIALRLLAMGEVFFLEAMSGFRYAFHDVSTFEEQGDDYYLRTPNGRVWSASLSGPVAGLGVGFAL